jgi:GTP-binding protein
VDGTLDDVAGAYRTIREELAQYGHGLAEKTEIVGLNKSDALDPEAMGAKCRQLQKVVRPGTQVHPLSGVTGAGVPDVVEAVLAAVSAERAGKDRAAAEASSLVHAL